MKKETVSYDNVVFFLTAVGMSFGTEYFAQAVLASFSEKSQFPTDGVGRPGYIRIDSSEIKKTGEDFWYQFTNKVRSDFLEKISYSFGSNMNFEGDLAEKVEIEKDGFKFSFEIRQYERDMEHKFEIINPEDLKKIPEKEKLGRVVCLKIAPC